MSLECATDERRSVPVYMSNQDFLFQAKYAKPRMAQGAFLVALEALYKSFQRDYDKGLPGLDVKRYGKPFFDHLRVRRANDARAVF